MSNLPDNRTLLDVVGKIGNGVLIGGMAVDLYRIDNLWRQP